MTFTTADICDSHSSDTGFQIAEPIFKTFGKKHCFSGQITTVKVFEDNVLIRQLLEQKVSERILVIDGGGSHRCALLGQNLASTACKNGCRGIIIYGCIRDSDAINKLPIGIRALHTHPLKSHEKGTGELNSTCMFAGIHFKSDHYLYADNDGIIVSQNPLLKRP
ncbi:regulator of ribonuclease activity A [Bathymodiolus platifrons methanotrophic gill symbiont]|uniref:ribonuclease E activity regulator RraA n=1 Tax=Bathymodiolus platifrons methanotrophic gill symbiont TaxID=113268 RepID=UPI000B415426|nr:ribonuclease E activity regulator RraA [Bathymodiolus platifrons methanotrophic gill symbiont]GAW85979.1 regulator of ribonuclease activity A [Bathymodiolus platifrons methanotrophic gill symbiont]